MLGLKTAEKMGAVAGCRGMDDNHSTVWQRREMVECECCCWEGEMKDEAEWGETQK